MKTNWIDSTIEYFDPAAGTRRRKHRMASEHLQVLERKYEAAAKGVRTDGWVTVGGTGGSANSEIGPALHLVRDRARDLCRNNPYATGGVGSIVSNSVGTGIICQPFSSDQSKADRALTLWRKWSESIDCDADGLHDFNGLQNLAFRSMVEGGEALVVRRWRKTNAGYKIPVPFQVQVLEGDYIDTAKSFEVGQSGGYILQGVEFNAVGRRVAYWLFDRHPGEAITVNGKSSLVSKRVDAKDIIHLFRADRAGQVRGIAWAAPCILRLKDFDLFEDAVNMRMQIAACFSAFVGDIEAPAEAGGAKSSLSDKLSPGAIEILPPGKTITFPNLPTAQDDGHSIRMLRSIAKGLGISYEVLSGDYSNVNYSSGRMGWIEMHRNIESWRWITFIPRMCNPVYAWFQEAASLVGQSMDDVLPLWTPPKREMIDPTKEIPAERDAVRSGFKSLSESIRESGRIPSEVFKEMAKDAETINGLGLVLDTDPSKMARGGNAQPVQNDPAQTGAGDTNA